MSGTLRILYVDDEKDLLEIGKLFLEESGDFSVTIINSAPAALDLLLAEKFDAIVSDYQMLTMDGIEFLKRVRNSGSIIPFILFTGKGREEVVIQALNEGADFYLQKGGEPRAQFAELINKIRYSIERKKAESDLQASEESLSTLINGISETAFMMTPDGRILAANDTTARRLGQTYAKDLIGKNVFGLIPEHLRKSRLIKIQEVIHSGEPVHFEDVRNGRIIDQTIYPVKTPGGIIDRLAVIGIDITERKQAEEIQNINSERLRLAQRIGHTGNWELDLFTGTIWASEEAFRIFSIPQPPDSIISIGDVEAQIPERERVHRALVDLIEKGVEYDLEYSIEPTDNTERKTVHSVATLIYNNEKKPVKVAGVVHDITDRKVAEEALRESRDRLGVILASLDDAVFMVDPATRLISDCNAAATRIFGYSREEMVGKETCFLHVDQVHVEQFGREAKATYEDPGYYTREFEMRRKDGCLFPTEHFVRPVRDSEGLILYVVSVVRDITERKQAEEKLLEAKARTATVLEGIADTFYSLDKKWRFTTVNPAAEKAPFGRPASELLGKVIWEVYPGLVGTFIQQHYYDAAKNFSLEHYEGQSPLNGRWYEVFMQGRRGGVDVYMRDISDRKQAEQEQKSAHERLKEAHRLAHIGTWDWAVETDTVTWSEELYNIAGRDPSLPAPTYAELPRCYTPSSWDLLNKAVTSALTNGEPYNLELEMVRPGGSIRWTNAFGGVNRDKNGKVIGLHGTVQDITEHKREEEERTRKSEELSAAYEQLVATEEELRQNLDEINKVQSDLVKSEERFRSAMNQLPGTAWAVDSDLRYTLSQGAGLTLLGLKPDLVVGMTLYEFFGTHDPNHPVISQHLRALNGENIEYDYTHEGILFRTYLSPLHDALGKISGVNGIAFNITEQKRAKEALHESEEKYRVLTENIPGCVYRVFVKEELRMQFFNAMCEQFTGYSPRELTHGEVCSIDRLIHPDDRPRVIEMVEDAIRLHKPFEVEYRMIIKDGSTRHFLERGRPVFDTEGNPEFIDGIINDITDRKHANLELVSAQERLKEAHRMAHIGTFDWIIEPDRVTWSEELFNIMGINPIFPAPTYTELPRFYTTESWDRLNRAVIQSRSDGEPFNLELEMVRPDGSTRWTVAFGGVKHDGMGKIIGFHGTVQDITERKRAEEALRDSEIRFREQYQNNPIAIFTWQHRAGDFVLVDFNKVADTLTKGRVKDYLGKFASDLYSSRPEIISEIRQCFSERATISKELISEHFLPGRSIKTTATFAPPDMIMVHMEDITESKQAEEALKKSEEKFREFFNNAGDAIAIHELEGHFLEVNDIICRRLGYSREELMEMSPGEVDEPEYSKLVPARIQELQQTGHIVFETIHRTKNGARIPVEVSSRVITYNGAPAIISTARDISDRKRVEEALRESEARYRLLADNATDVIWTLGLNGSFTYISPSIFQLRGYTPEEVRHQSLVEVISEGSLAMVQQMMNKMLEDVKSGVILDPAVFEVEQPCRNGSSVWTESIARLLVNATGTPTEFIGVSRNTTERKRVEEALHLANKKLTLLTSVTRHDINNQLTVLMGYLGILKKKQPDSALEGYFLKIGTAAERISAMIRFTKEYEEIGVHAPAWQDCQTLVETAAKEATLGQVTVKNDLPAGSEVFADPLIIKVFYNMMDNAVRHGGKITTIRFSVDVTGDEHVIICEDDGDGIVAAEKEKIFERGFGKNTGLGLFLSREILSITGIAIKETGKSGKGARFEISVPKGMWRRIREV